jgi:hypothetical protein
MTRRSIQFLFLSLLAFQSSTASAQLQMPKIGTRLHWVCSGPFAKEYTVTIRAYRRGLILYDGQSGKKRYWIWKSPKHTGTSLWVRKVGNQFQWFDKEDFDKIWLLRPGSRFKGAVPAQTKRGKWVWQYEITVGRRRTVNNRALGRVVVVPIAEKRRIYHGTYWSRITSLVDPRRGITVSWHYVDAKGTESCSLDSYSRRAG